MLKSIRQTSQRFAWIKSPWFQWGGIILFLAWLFYGLSAYYVVHKPFSVPQLFALADTTAVWWRFPFSLAAAGRSLLDIGFALWIAWVALGVGLYGLKWLKLSLASRALAQRARETSSVQIVSADADSLRREAKRTHQTLLHLFPELRARA